MLPEVLKEFQIGAKHGGYLKTEYLVMTDEEYLELLNRRVEEKKAGKVSQTEKENSYPLS